jgi:hypothetical protein
VFSGNRQLAIRRAHMNGILNGGNRSNNNRFDNEQIPPNMRRFTGSDNFTPTRRESHKIKHEYVYNA